MTDQHRASGSLVVGLCWFGLFCEGYDMGILGAVMSGLLADPAWGLTPMEAGMLATAAVVGTFFGGFSIGALSDRFGRRACFLGCFTLFSVAMLAASYAPTPTLFAVARFLGGIGVGGIVPVAAALTTEFARPGEKNRSFSIMYSGYSLGILAAAICAFFLLESHGWRFLMLLGAVPLVTLPVLIRILPESHGQKSSSKENAGSFRELVRGRRAGALAAFAMALSCGMILVYGLNTWLPQLMRTLGYDLGPSILFLGAYAIGSALGGIGLGWIADRIGARWTTTIAFALGGVTILALSQPLPLPITYGLTMLAGVGSVAAAVILTSYIASYFPASLRATAAGSCLSISRIGALGGPLLGGWLASSHLSMLWNFVAYAAVAMLGALCVLLVPKNAASSDELALS